MAESFVYRARDAGGAERRGVLMGASSAAVARDLSGKGWIPIDIRRGQGPKAAMTALAANAASADKAPKAAKTSKAAPAARDGVPAPAAQPVGPAAAPPVKRGGGKRAQEALAIVLRELAALLRAGVPLMRALQLAADTSGDERVRGALQRITRDLNNGHNLAAAAEHEHRASGLVSPYDVAMLKVGEQTGRLPEAFADLHRQREFVRATGEQVASALRYPFFVILTCLIAVVVVNLWVLPSFAKVFAQARTPLPMLTQLLMGMSGFMLAWWPQGLAAAVAGVFGWRRHIAGVSGRLWWDRVKLRLPLIGPILQGVVLARLSGALASGLSAGLTITDTLQVATRTLDNRWFEARLAQMGADLARGASIASAARQMGVLPPTMLQLFAIGEESGSLEELMGEICIHYRAEVEYAIKRLSSTLEPILIWFLGIGVLVLALGVFMPMWDLGRASIK